jgi:hypothetical protein
MLYEIFKGNTFVLAATSVADVKSTFDKLNSGSLCLQKKHT